MTTLSIPVKKTGRSIDVDTLRLLGGEAHAEHWNAVLTASPKLRYVLDYGLRQSLNDAHASIDASEPADNIMAAVQKKLDAIYAGTVRSGSTGGGKTADPIEREAVRISWVWWHDKKKADRTAAVAKLLADATKHAAMEIEADDDAKTRAKKAARAIVRARSRLPSVRDEAAANVEREKTARAADADDMSDMLDSIGTDDVGGAGDDDDDAE